MSVYALKSKFQNLLRPTVKHLFERGTTANQVTLFACAMSVFIGVVVAVGLSQSFLSSLLLLPVCLLVRMALNAIDGMLAREHQQQSALGGYLNELTDVVSDTALYLPLLFLPNVEAFLVWLVVWLATITEFAGVLGQVHGNGRRYDGPMGKSDRALLFGILAVVWVFYPASLAYTNATMWVVIGLLLFTIYRRVTQGLQTRSEA